MLLDAYTFDITGFEWVLGLGLMFGLALALTVLTEKGTIGFFAFLTVFAGMMVWVGLVDLWVLILCIIILIMVFYNSRKKEEI